MRASWQQKKQCTYIIKNARDITERKGELASLEAVQDGRFVRHEEAVLVGVSATHDGQNEFDAPRLVVRDRRV